MGIFLKDINLKGKTALITGATKGLGRGAALAIAEAGGNIIAIGRNQLELNTLKKEIKKFEKIGSEIGLLFQVADDLIDHKGSSLTAGKKTGKDKKKGKATLISLLGYKNTIKYANNLILRIKSKLKKYGSKSRNLSETLNYILNRNK